MEDKGRRYHKVGEFYTHFPDDSDGIIEALNANGYEVCETLEGGMIIMKEGEYTEIDEMMPPGYEDDDDDEYYDGYRPSGE